MSLRRLFSAAVVMILLGDASWAGIPPGWFVAGSAPANFEFALDTSMAQSGKASASITAKANAKSGEFGSLMQTVAADKYRGARWRLSGYLKTDSAGRAQLWMRIDGSDQKTLAFDDMSARPVTGTTGWTRYDIVLDVPTDSVDIAFGFLLISSGKVWADDFRLERVDAGVPVTAVAPMLSKVLANPDFEDTASSQMPPGWVVAGSAPSDYEVAVDTTTAASGRASASLIAKRGASNDGFATLTQTIAADNYRGARLRLAGYLRTDAAGRAQMWMRVDGSGGKAVAFDNMDARPVTGTTGWTKYQIVLDVPTDSADIAVGFLLFGAGKVWGDDFKLEKVASSVPVTASGPTLARAPVNPDFEDADSSQSAVWTPRKLSNFSTRFAGGSCDRMVDRLRFVLLQLGARASDLHIDARRCYAGPMPILDASFSVLAPADVAGSPVADASVAAHWQTVQVGGGGEVKLGVADCFYLESVRQQVLPLFSSKDVKAISLADCARLNVGLSAQVLKPQGE